MESEHRSAYQPSPEPEGFEFDESVSYSVYKSCAIQFWRGPVQLRHIKIMEDRWLRHTRDKEKIFLFSVVLAGAPTPSGALREQIKGVYLRLQDRIGGLVTVLEDQGIKGSTGSMLMTTIMMMTRVPYPYKNTTTVPQAANWIGAQDPQLKIEKVIEHVEMARTRYSEVCRAYLGEALMERASRARPR